MVHPRVLRYLKPDSSLRAGPCPLDREQAERVVDSLVQGARAIFTRQIFEFYVESWRSYSSLPPRENPGSDDAVHAVCSRIFEEVKHFVSHRPVQLIATVSVMLP